MRKKNNDDERTTVIKVRDNSDWGRIFFDACYLFNKGLAEYFMKYAKKYDEGKLEYDDAGREAAKLVEKRDRIISEREVFHNAVKKASSRKVESFRKYAKALPIGDAVARWRMSGNESDYDSMINLRNCLNMDYHSMINEEKKALADERRHIDENLFMTREINHKVKSIDRIVDKRKFKLDHTMSDDAAKLYNFITSEGQAERLMAVCINILNTYSEKEFFTMLDSLERERIADAIYRFFSDFDHNYDFIAGCYDVDESRGVLVLRPENVLESKLYNGYYFTIRGFVQRSYAKIRFEKFNVESADSDWCNDCDDADKRGIDKYNGMESSVHAGGNARDANPIDGGVADCWNDCHAFLKSNIGVLSKEMAHELSVKFPKNPYYNNDDTTDRMACVIRNMLSSIGVEILDGNIIGKKFKHIVLDSMGGAESNDEWNQNVSVITGILKKYIRMFFENERKEHACHE